MYNKRKKRKERENFYVISRDVISGSISATNQNLRANIVPEIHRFSFISSFICNFISNYYDWNWVFVNMFIYYVEEKNEFASEFELKKKVWQKMWLERVGVIKLNG